jgi:L-asparaginase
MHDPEKTIAVSARRGLRGFPGGLRRGTQILALAGSLLLGVISESARAQGPVEASETRPGVVLFTTGGTIQSRGAHRLKLSEYSDGRVPPAELLEDVPELKELARVEVVEISNVGSGNMTSELLLKLARGLNAALARPDVSGAVVTHGTGTLEETAYFLHLVVRSPKPVVVVGAMRPWSAVSRDGPLNLYQAVRTAVTAEAAGKGVLVLLDDTIHSARFVTKSHTTRVETFVSREIGPLGYADGDRVVFYRSPLTRHTSQSEFDVGSMTNLPAVEVVYGYQEASPRPLEALVQGPESVAGLVLADSSPAVSKAVYGALAKGVVVVQGDRKGAGRVLTSERQAGRGLVTADSLNPQKARVLLRLALTKTREPREIQRIFNEY